MGSKVDISQSKQIGNILTAGSSAGHEEDIKLIFLRKKKKKKRNETKRNYALNLKNTSNGFRTRCLRCAGNTELPDQHLLPELSWERVPVPRSCSPVTLLLIIKVADWQRGLSLASACHGPHARAEPGKRRWNRGKAVAGFARSERWAVREDRADLPAESDGGLGATRWPVLRCP